MNKESMKAVLQDVECGAWWFKLGGSDQPDQPDQPYLQVLQKTKCNVTGEPYESKGRKWRLSPHMTRSEIVQTALKAVLTAEEHEVRERFKYRGQPIFDPHYDVDELWHLRQRGEQALDVRDGTAAKLENSKGEKWYWKPGKGWLS